MKKLFCFSIILIAFFASSCKYANPKYIKEGVIEYDTKPVDENNPMAGFAPGKMTVKFKDNMLAAEMSTMGVFTTTFIFNPAKKNLIQLVKMFDVKQACIDDEKTIAELGLAAGHCADHYRRNKFLRRNPNRHQDL